MPADAATAIILLVAFLLAAAALLTFVFRFRGRAGSDQLRRPGFIRENARLLYRAAEHVPGGSVTTLSISASSGTGPGLAGYDQIQRSLLARMADRAPLFRFGFGLGGGFFGLAWLAALARFWPFTGVTQPLYLLAASLVSTGLAWGTRPLARAARGRADRSKEEAGERKKRDRQVLIERVRRDWIGGVLGQSLYQAVRADLGLTGLPEVVDRSLDVTVEDSSGGRQTLSADTPIGEIFDRAEGFLLILGEPGTGKTTLMLELTEELLERAEADESCPVPVVFNLSSWDGDGYQLWNWLLSELAARYDVPEETAESWFFDDTVIPLLDGLDELDPELRPFCIEEINSYRGLDSILPVVVCSRLAEYEAAGMELRACGTVTVNPLDRRWVESCLNLAGPRLAGVRAAIERKPELLELMSKPLMLTLLLAAPSAAAVASMDKTSGRYFRLGTEADGGGVCRYHART